MTKNAIKKFRKNEYSYEDEDHYDTRSYYLEKKKAKRVDRAIKTLDIRALTEEEGLDPLDIEDEIWQDEDHTR